MARRGSVTSASEPLSSPVSPTTLPRQLDPIVQRRPSTAEPHSHQTTAVAAIATTTSIGDAESRAFFDLHSATVDPLLAHHTRHPQQQQQQLHGRQNHPSWAATHEQRAHTLARVSISKKHSIAHKYSASAASDRRTSVSSAHSAAAGRKISAATTSQRYRHHRSLAPGSGDPDRDRCESQSDSDGDETEADAYAATMIRKADAKRAQKQFRDNVGSDAYVDGDRVFRGSVDRRGITPAVTFTTVETPPSQAKNPLVTGSHATACGFCSSTNLVWTLRCAFCGSARMSDVPRLKYLVDMVLSVEPYIKPEKLAKKILDYAKFDRIAIKVEEKFKQASLVRAKIAITMMSRTINALWQQIVRMMFTAWKGHNAIATQHEAIMHRLIMIKDIQIRSNRKELAFAMWKGYVARIVEERAQRLAIATRRNELTKMRRPWSAWTRFVLMRTKEKMEQMKQHYEAEMSETPNEALREMERLKDTIAESRKLVFAATNTTLEILNISLRTGDHDVLKTLQLTQMYPNTVGQFFETVHGQEILNGLSSGHIASSSDEFGIDDDKDDDAMRAALEAAHTRIERMHPSESLIQWLNFQHKRMVEMGGPAPASTLTDKSTTQQQQQPVRTSASPIQGANSPSSATTPATNSTGGVRERVPSSAPASRTSNSKANKTKEKKLEFKEIKGLQDLRASIASPGVMLKLLCHTSLEAQAEHQRLRATEMASNATTITAESSTTATTLSPAAQLQLKIYLKLAHRILNLPPDVISRDSFALNDFDSLYAYVVYLYVFHSNAVAPGLELSPRYHLSYNFLVPQWDKLKATLVATDFDPFAQQQYYIFLAKLTRVHRQFLRFRDICGAVATAAQAHQDAAIRATYNDFTRRVLGQDSSIAVALEKETLASWVALPAAKLRGLCDSDDELRAIEHVFKDNVLDLVKIFRIYGSAAGGKGILEQEFLKVMTKAGVTDKKNILRSHLQLIYQQSRQPPPASSIVGVGGAGTTALAVGGASSASRDDVGSSGPPSAVSTTSSSNTAMASPSTGDGDDETEDRGATPNEFFEALTRVAHHNFQKRRDTLGYIAAAMHMPTGSAELLRGASPTSSVAGLSLLAFVTELVVERVVPLTKKFQEQGLTFKKQMIHPDVQHVCKAQEKKLKRIFTVYSQKNRNPASRGKLMDVSDFEGLLKDRRLVDALFPFGRIKQLVAFVQQDGGSGSDSNGLDADSEFVFSEFVEALAAIAVYRNANPYLPLAKKLEAFFDENF